MNSSMTESKLTFMPGLEVLKFFKNKNVTVKVFQKLLKYFLYSQKNDLDENILDYLKVSGIS